MYLESKLDIYPDLSSRIERIRPTKFFAKLWVALSLGLASKKEEIQTYTAISILQSLNIVLRSMGVDNIVRISKDDVEIYYDSKGEKGDLPTAIEVFSREVDPIESDVFETLSLVLEHEDPAFKYLVEISIKRRHSVNEAPIRITTHAVPSLILRKGGERESTTQARVRAAIGTQEEYEQFQSESRAAFEQFVEQVALALRAHVPISKIERVYKTKVLRKKQGRVAKAELPKNEDLPLMHRRYHGCHTWSYSIWMWSDHLRDLSIHVSDLTLVDPVGSEIVDIGPEGFNAAANDVLNSEVDFVVPPGDSNVLYGGHEFDAAIAAAGYSVTGVNEDGVGVCTMPSSSSWFDGDWIGDWDGLSCSSCGGCGGD